MSITDELRKYVQGWRETPNLMDDLDAGDIDGLLGDFEHIADHIDAEYEQRCSEAWMRGHDAWAAIDRSDEMAEHGWIRLPKDADGEYIHVGDWMTPNGMNMDFKVRQMHFNGEWSLDLEGFGISHTCPDMCHHHAPTVEDVLDEMLQRFSEDGYEGGMYDLIAEYAEKLQLRGDAE